MNADRLLGHYKRIADAPAADPRLRRFILDLAVRGKLVEQDPNDEPASELLKRRKIAISSTWPFELPASWAWVNVGAVAVTRLGKMLDKAKNKGTPRRYLRNINVRWFDFDLSDLLEMRFEDSELSEFTLQFGDVLICEGGEPGRAAVWDGREDDIYFQKAIHRIRFLNIVDSSFFVKALRASADDERLAEYFTGTGIKHFTGKSLADNQGIDVLVSLDRILTGDKDGSARDHDDFDVLLVSDASGHMEPVHRLKDRAFVVMNRTLSIFQFQIRRKMLKILQLWQGSVGGCEFAFVHLFMNLKDRLNPTPRVPSEYIPALGRVRTDLDQFSFIEREALMYHGYTLIDAQIKEHCKNNLAAFIVDAPKLKQPPLFLDRPSSDQATEQCASETKLRKRVKDVLTAGNGSVFLLRSRCKYPKKSWLVLGPALSLLLGGWWADRHYLDSLYAFTLQLERWLSFMIPDWVWRVLENVVGISRFPLDTQVLTFVVLGTLWSYFVAFLTYEAMRWMVSQWDRKDYQSLTGESPTVHWATEDA